MSAALRLRLSLLQMAAARIEERAAARRAARPAPRNEAERLRFRRRDYDAIKRAKQTRAVAAAIIRELSAEPWRDLI